MNYIIEGTVSKYGLKTNGVLTSENSANSADKIQKNVCFCITGSEGYAIKQKEKLFNVFCPEEMPNEDETQICYIADREICFSVSQEYENLLSQASVHGKRIRFSISDAELKKYIEKDNSAKIKDEKMGFVTLLSD